MENLERLIEEQLSRAAADPKGRSARIVVHDGPLRQTLMALSAESTLEDHNSPPAASLQVLRGRVAVTAQEPEELGAGEIAALTHHRHGVRALEDAVFLLTTVTGIPGRGSHGSKDPQTAETAQES